MRILAIRGKNLASLSTGFDVDFQAEPLASAGLFAITGPTGAGKSTLLDALCLALYDATPRLARATSRSDVPDVGETSVAQHDPRTILRRGAAEGFAEVDFVGNDGISYRARWTVRRARNKAEGKLQASEITLESFADGQLLGDRRKTETLKLIESKIGLSFTQFTRAVLLAQNDFATFLKASDDERAELMQTLTGTETFAEISKQAYARMREEKEQLDRLAEQLKSQSPLPQEARGEKEARHREYGEQLKTLEKNKVEIESWLRWHEQLAKQRAIETEADKKLDAAKAARDSAEGRYRQLARIGQIQPARPLFAERERLAGEIASVEKTLGECRKNLDLAAKNAESRTADVDVAVKQLAVAEEARIKAQPLIDSAKSLDAKLAALTQPYEQAVHAQAAADKHHRESVRKQEEARQAVQRLEEALASGERWLSGHSAQKALAEGWQGWDAMFAQALSQDAERTGLAADIKAQTTRNGDIASSLAKAQAEYADATKAHHAAREKLDALTAAWKAYDADAMAERKQRLEERREQLVQGEHAWSEWSRLQQRHRQLDEQKQALNATLEQSGKALAELAQQKPHLEQECAAAARAYDLAQLAASEGAETLRASLQDDQPCPVCGALEHPYALHSVQADAMLKALRANLDGNQKALASLSETMAARTSDRNHAQRQLALVEKELAEVARARAEQQERWAPLAIASEVSGIADQDRAPWFVEQQNQLKTALARMKHEEDGYREAAKQKDEAQAALDRMHRALETAQKSLSSLEADQKTARHALETAQQRQGELDKQLEATLARLDGAFPDAAWRAGWQDDPAGFVAHCRRDAETWLRQQKQVTELAGQISTQKATLAAQAEVCLKAEADLRAVVTSLQAQAAELKALRVERQAILDGKPVKDIESALGAAIEDAKARQGKAQSELQKAQVERTRQDEALRQATALLAKHQAEHGEVVRKFDAWLDDFNRAAGEDALTPEALHGLLAFDNAWIEQERNALRALDQVVESALAVQRVQREARAAHEKTKPSELDEDVLKETLAKIRADIAATTELCANLRAEILADDERRKNTEALRATMAEQEKKTRLWSQLGELIGSADGKKFRNFAQQLTLDILLGYGNRHLESLSRRYRIERIKDSLGLLVIDQDMGDEIRSVHSLSGGESFLLSLALALGLASLSSHRVRVESLFIDEGFGSLDSESLRVAMDALDTLQAQGRKVGVISHVQEMTERIGVRIEVKRQPGGQSRVAVV